MPFSSNETLEERDIALLRKVLEDICRDRLILTSSPQAHELGRSLIDWYLFGVRSPDELKAMIEPWPEFAGPSTADS